MAQSGWLTSGERERKRPIAVRCMRAERQEKNNIRLNFQSIYWYANQKHDRQINHSECVCLQRWTLTIYTSVCVDVRVRPHYMCESIEGMRTQKSYGIRIRQKTSSYATKRPNDQTDGTFTIALYATTISPNRFGYFHNTHCLQNEDLIGL